MAFNLVVPRNRASRARKPAGGAEFWKKFWEDDVNDESRARYEQMYTRRKSSIVRTSRAITRVKEDTNAKLYAEVKLDEHATAKTSSPNAIWTETGLEIVAGKDASTFVVSGTAEEFRRLQNIADRSNFDAAYTGAGLNRKKDKNIARELFAVTAMKDLSAVPDGRTSSYIKSFLESGANTREDSIIELWSNQPHAEYDNIFRLLNRTFPQANIQKRNERLFYHNMSFLASLSRQDIERMLASEEFNFISKVREMPYLVIQRCIPTADLRQIQILDPITDETVALIDSGIHHPLVQRLRSHHLNYLEAHQQPDENHGTFVASRILFGNDVFSQVTAGEGLAPSAMILDVQVLYTDRDKSRVNPEKLKEAILEVITRYTNVAIFNLSIAEETAVKPGEISELTEFLDYMAREHDVIFICSVGNQEVYISHTYEQTFKRRESWIAAPSDGLNVISVGSSTSNCAEETICAKQHHPSPFTRVGGLGLGIKKPDLVHEGGNVRTDVSGVYSQAHFTASNNVYGVEGIDGDGLSKDIGTSQSGPLVTRECVLLLNYLKRSNFASHVDLANNKANLVKALLIHSTSRQEQALPDEETQRHALGFGIPSYLAVVKDDENQITLTYADGINFVDKKHKIRINLPEYLIGKKVEMTMTVVYNPPVDKNYPELYKMVHLDASLRLVEPTFSTDGEVEEKEKITSLNPTNSWENYRHESQAVIHLKKTPRALNSQVLEVLLQLSATRPYENKILGREADEIQNYALVLTLRDKSESGRFREEVLAMNELEEIVENQVQIATQ